MFLVGGAVRKDKLTELKQLQKLAVMRGNEWERLKKSLSPILTFKECEAEGEGVQQGNMKYRKREKERGGGERER